MIVLDLANRPYHDCFVNCYDSFFMLSAKLKPPSCIYSISKFNFQGPLIIIQDTGPSWLEKVPSSHSSPGNGPTKCTLSNKDNCVLVLGKQNSRPACCKGKLEFKFSSSPIKFKILFTRLFHWPGCQSERYLRIALLLNAHTALIFVEI